MADCSRAVCGRCNSGICSACCKCPKRLGRPSKQDLVASSIEPQRRNECRASRPTYLGELLPEGDEFSSAIRPDCFEIKHFERLQTDGS